MTRRAASREAPFRLREAMNGMGEPPGKVWFFELAAAVIDADRCIQCGACVAACPSDSLGDELERPALPREDVHRLLAVLGLLPARRPALRGDVATATPERATTADDAAAVDRTQRTPTRRSAAVSARLTA